MDSFIKAIVLKIELDQLGPISIDSEDIST
jgi:hypothetical protein